MGLRPCREAMESGVSSRRRWERAEGTCSDRLTQLISHLDAHHGPDMHGDPASAGSLAALSVERPVVRRSAMTNSSTPSSSLDGAASTVATVAALNGPVLRVRGMGVSRQEKVLRPCSLDPSAYPPPGRRTDYAAGGRETIPGARWTTATGQWARLIVSRDTEPRRRADIALSPDCRRRARALASASRAAQQGTPRRRNVARPRRGMRWTVA